MKRKFQIPQPTSFPPYSVMLLYQMVHIFSEKFLYIWTS